MIKYAKPLSICMMILSIAIAYPARMGAQTTADSIWPAYGRIGLSYTYETNTTQQYNICHAGLGLTDRLVIEAPVIGFSRIADDPYNSKGSYSFVPLAIPLILAVALADSGSLKSPLLKATVTSLAIIHGALNSTLYYTLNGTMQQAKSSPTSKVIVSPFIKNETSWFVTRGTDWLQIAPGAGIRIYVGKEAGLIFSAGVQRAFQTNFKGRWKRQDMLFFNLGFDVDFDSGMSI